jgi:hypothetical protein
MKLGSHLETDHKEYRRKKNVKGRSRYLHQIYPDSIPRIRNKSQGIKRNKNNRKRLRV